MDIFELQPLNIYEVYMKSFGRMNTDQVAVQTNDDTLDQEVQTDEIETDTRWSQFSNEVQSFGGIVFYVYKTFDHSFNQHDLQDLLF